MFAGIGNYKFSDDDSKETIVRPNAENLRPIYETYGAFRIEGKSIARYLHPAETGVIQYGNGNPGKYCNGWNLVNWDIVDYNWTPLFNDESIHYIEHFYENWFLIGYLPCEFYEKDNGKTLKSVKLYNLSSKEFVDIKIDTPYPFVSLRETKGFYHSGDGMKVFHNRYYETGEYGNINVKHGSYELLFDKEIGGREAWIAAFVIEVRNNSPNVDSDYIVYYIDKDWNLKSFPVTAKILSSYHFEGWEK